MSELEVVSLPNGQFAENCYLIADRGTREAVIIDPGEEPAMFLAELDTRAWHLRGIWLTHAHVDHIIGVGAVQAGHRRPHPPPSRSTARSTTRSPSSARGWACSCGRHRRPTSRSRPGAPVRVGRFAFEVRFTPGHSPGSVSFVGHDMVFGGDVLFNGSIGRTDLPGGDYATLMARSSPSSSRSRTRTVVHSGHGPDTTIGVERLTNPFLTGAFPLG